MWFNSSDIIGAVLILNNSGIQKAYIGNGYGYNERADIKKIAEHGCKLPLRVAKAMFPEIDDNNYM
jgi:hypothetical protein